MKRNQQITSSHEAEDASRRRNRRQALALGGAAAAAAAVAALGTGGGKKAQAHGTTHTTSNTADPAIHGDNTADGSGVEGSSLGGPGVRGHSDSPASAGVIGSGPELGVLGESADRDGVLGIGGNIGVEGHGTGDDGLGVLGLGENNVGVFALSETRSGVMGWTHGIPGEPDPFVGGVLGVAAADTPGVYAVSGTVWKVNPPEPDGGLALRTRGRVRMDCVRKKRLRNKSNLITLPTAVKAKSGVVIMATMQGEPGNDALIRRAFRVDSSHIRIVFNKKPARATKVGYWVVHTG